MAVLNLRSAHRGGGRRRAGPEGNVTKLVLSENGHEAAAILAELTGPNAAFLDRAGAMSGTLTLILRHVDRGRHVRDQRNQIGERILGRGTR